MRRKNKQKEPLENYVAGHSYEVKNFCRRYGKCCLCANRRGCGNYGKGTKTYNGVYKLNKYGVCGGFVCGATVGVCLYKHIQRGETCPIETKCRPMRGV